MTYLFKERKIYITDLNESVQTSVLASQVMSILNLKRFKSQKNKRIIWRKKKLKKKKKTEERKTGRSKKDEGRRRSIKKDNSEYWFRKDKYIEINYSGSIITYYRSQYLL